MITDTKKVAVVSGAAGYVGSAIAHRLIKDGWRVACLCRRARENDLESLNGKIYYCDITEPSRVSEVFDSIEKDMGPIYLAVHAAGNMPLQKKLHMLSAEEFMAQVGSDVGGAFNFLSEAARRMKPHGEGVLIGITTAGVVSQKNTKSRGVYAPIKFAIQGVLTALKEELADSGIGVYSVAPGVMPGGMNSGTPQAFLDMIRAKTPEGILATAEDVAEKVSSLISVTPPESNNLTFLVAPETE